MNYETVIGLEVHCELSTKTKIFCSCKTDFGKEPNTQVCPICLGLPGTLPSLNKSVVDYAIKTGLATNCTITEKTKFDRKNYFYPDLPKAYQVSQLYAPICQGGYIDIEAEGIKKRIRIKEIHMEEDAGKLIHDADDKSTLIDYNRCGVPLLEIVSEADFSNEKEVIAYLTKLRSILQYIDVSDCKMEQGSFRADVNLSVRPVGDKKLGTRTEMKNLNSFRSVVRAIISERERQIDVLNNGGEIVQETRRWDDSKNKSYAMRDKENATDYRYFPESDIAPIEIDNEQIEKIRESLPLLPDEVKNKFITEYKLPQYDADILTGSRFLVDMFEKAERICNMPKEVSNWIMGEVLRLAAETATDVSDISFDAENLGKLILLQKNNVINRGTAKEVFEKMFKENIEPEKYIAENNLGMISDDTLIEKAVSEAFSENPNSIEEYRQGNLKVEKFLMGQVMKKLKGKAAAADVSRIISHRLKQL